MKDGLSFRWFSDHNLRNQLKHVIPVGLYCTSASILSAMWSDTVFTNIVGEKQRGNIREHLVTPSGQTSSLVALVLVGLVYAPLAVKSKNEGQTDGSESFKGTKSAATGEKELLVYYEGKTVLSDGNAVLKVG